MSDVAPALHEDNLFTAARRVLRNIRADDAQGGLMSVETVKASEWLSRKLDEEERAIKKAYAAAQEQGA